MKHSSHQYSIDAVAFVYGCVGVWCSDERHNSKKCNIIVESEKQNFIFGKAVKMDLFLASKLKFGVACLLYEYHSIEMNACPRDLIKVAFDIDRIHSEPFSV